MMTDSMTAVRPEQQLARNGLYRKIADAEFVATAESAIAASFSADDSSAQSRCALTDMTPVVRGGFRGKASADHLQALGLPIPEKPNQALTTDKGETVLRLSNTEYWLLGFLADFGQTVADVRSQAMPAADCYPLFCNDSHAWLTLSGEHCAAVMAKLCGVDMRAEVFPSGSIAQTSVARINAIVVSHSVGGKAVFSLLFDTGYHAYMWDVLLDASSEFGGVAAGVTALMVD